MAVLGAILIPISMPNRQDIDIFVLFRLQTVRILRRVRDIPARARAREAPFWGFCPVSTGPVRA